VSGRHGDVVGALRREIGERGFAKARRPLGERELAETCFVSEVTPARTQRTRA
jgi:hypothetical protein